MSKALIVASVASMIDQFNRPNIKLLKELGYDVHVACNFIEGSTCSSEKIQQLKTDLQSEEVTFSQIDFARNITRITQNLRAYRQIKHMLKQEKFSLIYCTSPIGGFLTRTAAKNRRYGVKVIYAAHGFHFYKGAPIINWLMYYPVEWLCAHWTDVLITTNKEDYARAQKHMHAKRVEYVPGTGIDLRKFASNRFSQEEEDKLRASIGVGKEDKLLLSVGELNANKNHEVVIRAIAKLNNKSVHYAIAGQGELHDYLLNLAKELGVSEQFHLLGFRSDVADLYSTTDACVFPSIREGLGNAAIEGMASGLPLICADNRGTRDYAINGENAIVCKYDDIDQFVKALTIMLNDTDLRIKMGNLNKEKAKRYDVNVIITQMKKIYEETVC